MNMVLLLLSLLGFFLLVRWAGREYLHPAFLPAITVSAVSCLVCLGGMLGGLAITEGILTGIGLVSFAGLGFREIWRGAHGKRAGDWRDMGWVIGCFVVFFVGCAIWTRNQFLYSYDDFSHWGLVARIMTAQHRLPVDADGISFPGYPLGSAAFIDYCCAILGGQGNHFLFAQAIMTVSFFLSLLSCAGEKPVGYVVTALLAVLLMCYHNSINTLSVDNLLGAAFLSALLMYLHHREDWKEALPFLMIVLAGLVMIKNSGLFLAIMILGFFLIRMIRQRERISPVWLWAALPVLIYAAWHLHVRSSFTSYGKHYMSLYLYYANLRGNVASLVQILQIILPRMISPLNDLALWLIPAFALLYMATPKEERQPCRRVIWMAVVIFLLYEAGTLIMYVCSMDAGEVMAHQGDDYARYNSTVTVGLLGLMFYLTGQILRVQERKLHSPQAGLMLASVALVCGILAEGVSLPHTATENQSIYPDPYAFFRIAEESRLPQTDRVIILSRELNDDGYINYLAEYYLPGASYAIYQDGPAAEQDYQNHPDDLLINLLDGTWESPG